MNPESTIQTLNLQSGDTCQTDEMSAQRLAAIVESSEDAIVTKDLNGVISTWNKGAERIFGYKAAEAIGKPVAMLIPAGRDSEETEILARIRKGERIDHYETVRQRKDGTLIDISLSISPLRDGSGRIVGASKIARDVTFRKRLERQQQILFELVTQINQAPALSEICTTAVDGIRRSQGADRAAILLYDSADVMRFHAWCGLSDEYRDAVEGHSPWKRDDPDPQPVCLDNVANVPLDEHLRAAIEREGIRALAFIPLRHRQNLLGKFMIYYDTPHQFSPMELRPAQTFATQVVFAVERHKSKESMEQLVAERTASLREAVAQMEEFSYTVSHDLRAPLRSMKLYSEALLEDTAASLPAEANHCLQRIAANADRMDKMIKDLLTFSRIARADFRLEKVATDRLVRQIVEQYPGLQEPRADIRIDPLPPVLGHEPSLTQAFSNLLNNAVKFIAPNVKPIIHVWSERHGRQVRLWISDNGIGIDPRYQHRLFRMFERIHPELGLEGTGVGLAIVRKAAERMGGKVGMESDGKNGSKFWLEFSAADDEN